MKKHLFLTGEIQIGKSTLIDKYIDYLAGKKSIAGFRTCPYINDKIHRGFQIIGVNEKPKVNDAHIVGIRDEVNGRFKGIVDEFDTYGAELLKEARENKYDMAIMDELGFFELNASRFRLEVHKVLDQNINVLGVVKKRTNPFLEEIRDRSDVCVIEVDRKNRDELIDYIIDFFDHQNQICKL